MQDYADDHPELKNFSFKDRDHNHFSIDSHFVNLDHNHFSFDFQFVNQS